MALLRDLVSGDPRRERDHGRPRPRARRRHRDLAALSRTALPRSRVDRTAFIVEACRGKDVLHLGCADHPYTRARIASGTWLHARIAAVAARCLGVDSDRAAIAWLAAARAGAELAVADAEALDALEAGPFDVVVAGEIIEHLANPGRFLETARTVLRADGRVVITTVNAFCLRRFVRIAFGAESVHPDHVCYYSHATLATLARRYGFELVEAHAYRLPNRRPRLAYWLERAATALSPNWGEGLVHVYGLGRAPRGDAP